MKKSKTGILRQGFWVFFAAIFLLEGTGIAKAQQTTVEGVWQIISVSSDTERELIGKKVSIARKGESYEVQEWDGVIVDNYTGNDKRIAMTRIEKLKDPTDVHESASPPVVEKYFAGQQVPIRYSYTLSADGNTLTREQDSKHFHWQTNTVTGEVRNIRYEIKSGYYKRTFNRVPQPTSVAKVQPSSGVSFAQVESRGEFYFVTKSGRKLTGAEATTFPLEEGANVVTGSNGLVKLVLPDDTIFTVGPKSDLVIDKFVYDASPDSRTIVAHFSKGVFRWITGRVHPIDPARMKVTLPVGDLGIRGTDFEITVEPDGSGMVVLHLGRLEITEKKTGFTFLMNAGEKTTFAADGSFSRPQTH